MKIQSTLPIIIIVSCILFPSFTPLGQNEIILTFIKHLNDGDTDKAELLTTNDFSAQYQHPGTLRTRYDYFKRLKSKQGARQILTVESISGQDDKFDLKISTGSELNKYLKIPDIRYSYIVYMKDELISKLEIDTLPGYNSVMKVNDVQWKKFEQWASVRYPQVRVYYLKLQYGDSLLNLARQYSEEINKTQK